LAARKAISEIEGEDAGDLSDYSRSESEKYRTMVEKIRRRLNLTTLRYQTLDDLVDAISLPKEKLCTYCWDGAE
jgi:amidophosphoribosyltransferase